MRVGKKFLFCLALCFSFFSIYGREVISRLELTDEILPRTDPQVSTQFYQMLKDIDLLFKDNSITYWLTAGSLLGAIRHQGIIPWDDDVDLAFFERDIGLILSLRPALKKLGYEIFVLPDYIKIYLAKGHTISKESGGEYSWKYPFIDLFPMKQYEDKVSHAGKRLYDRLSNKDWYYYTDVSSLSLASFGSLQVPIPSNSSTYLERLYGQDVWDIAYANYCHSQEKKLQIIKVRLVTKECAPDISLKR